MDVEFLGTGLEDGHVDGDLAGGGCQAEGLARQVLEEEGEQLVVVAAVADVLAEGLLTDKINMTGYR